ncbi:MAG: amino acid racemase [Gammaproteobacteria bacterium]|nr:amino acid racemase [Gammaproteobacteria bacterium]
MSEVGLTAGVLGGLGPDATVDFMSRVIALTPASTDQDHVRLLVDQNPRVPDRQDAILRNGESPGPVLAAMAAGLEAAGADFVVMPCNTAHAFEADIVGAISIPFISIVDASIESLPVGVTAVGLLETPACSQLNLYGAALSERGLRQVSLEGDEREELMRLVYAIKGGDRVGPVRSAMKNLAVALASRGAEAIISGCTEVPLVLADKDIDVSLISSTEALARETIAIARGEHPLPTT